MARICREYGMDYWECLKLPLKTFWSFNRQIDRLRAEEDQHRLQIAASAQSGDAAKKLSETLQRQIGEPVRVEKKLDLDRFKELKSKFGSKVSGDPSS